jgi:hypothetical protein
LPVRAIQSLPLHSVVTHGVRVPVQKLKKHDDAFFPASLLSPTGEQSLQQSPGAATGLRHVRGIHPSARVGLSASSNALRSHPPSNAWRSHPLFLGNVPHCRIGVNLSWQLDGDRDGACNCASMATLRWSDPVRTRGDPPLPTPPEVPVERLEMLQPIECAASRFVACPRRLACVVSWQCAEDWRWGLT